MIATLRRRPGPLGKIVGDSAVPAVPFMARSDDKIHHLPDGGPHRSC
ncbi:hypothetical protein [Streptomyces piniterrae]|nr:hypothetical protein [Streptomyces piniterrae]